MTDPQDFIRAFDALPGGSFGGTFDGKRYRIIKSSLVAGLSQKLEAEELCGKDYISFNLYRLQSGKTFLKPCQMPAAKVIDFVMGVAAD